MHINMEIEVVMEITPLFFKPKIFCPRNPVTCLCVENVHLLNKKLVLKIQGFMAKIRNPICQLSRYLKKMPLICQH